MLWSTRYGENRLGVLPPFVGAEEPFKRPLFGDRGGGKAVPIKPNLGWYPRENLLGGVNNPPRVFGEKFSEVETPLNPCGVNGGDSLPGLQKKS